MDSQRHDPDSGPLCPPTPPATAMTTHRAHAHRSLPGGGHGHVQQGDAQKTLHAAAAWTAVIFAVEVGGAWLAHSIALAADAGHVLTDVGALGLAAWAGRVAGRPATDTNTYGFGRATVLAGLFNAALLMLIAAGIGVAAILRLVHPHPVEPPWMIAAAAIALIINLYVGLRLHGHAHADLNLRSAWLHVLSDAAGSAAVILAAIAIAATGWTVIDPALSLVLAAAIAWAGWRTAGQAVHVLLEGAPDGLDATDVAASLVRVPGVRGVHHLHVWSIGGGRRAVSGHLVLGPISLEDGQRIARAAEGCLAADLAVEHCTLQIEVDAGCRECEPDEEGSAAAHRHAAGHRHGRRAFAPPP